MTSKPKRESVRGPATPAILAAARRSAAWFKLASARAETDAERRMYANLATQFDLDADRYEDEICGRC